MKIQSLVLSAVLAAAAAVSISSVAGPEAHHPNIITARNDVNNAIEHLRKAQRANEYDMGGHAARAEQLLSQALEEMRLAAEVDNVRR
ncbi:MAG TPA: hypothetical protein VH328_03900 [Burkholderiaceae bacterium]|jgi:hypothetical protein|nr:hypothetical protein [Burkholderiaceae bacterium]